MAGRRDYGELLTRFDEVFGSLVEHEVIKLILQSCEWDAEKASDTLMGMIDKTSLSPHVLAALSAGNLCSNPNPRPEPSITNTAPGPALNSTHSVKSPATNTTSHSTSSVSTVITEVPPTNSAFAQVQDVASVLQGQGEGSASPHRISVMGDAASPSRTCVHADTSSPRVCAQGDVALPHTSIGEDAAFLPHAFTNTREESAASSPSCSPLRPSKTNDTASDGVGCQVSQWVLAPEFVPNAFNIKAVKGGGGGTVWPRGMSSRLMNISAVTPAPQPPEQKATKKDHIINKILSGAKMMVIMRGLPGSGKTTLAKELKGRNGIILSTDDFFCDKRGRYNYDPARIGEAHQWNRHRACQRLQQGRTPIIIDNTNLQKWEMKPYVILALQYGYEVDLLDANTSWKLSPKELAKKNVHGVPAKKIAEMKERYEQNVSVEHMIGELQSPEVSPSKNPSLVSKMGRVVGNENDSLVELTMDDFKGESFSSFQKEESDSDSDDIDVIVEGYEEEEEPDSLHRACASDDEVYGIQVKQAAVELDSDKSKVKQETATDNSSVPEGTEKEFDESAIFIDESNSPIDLTLAVQVKQNEDHSPGHEPTCMNEMKSTEVSDEERMQILLDEANRSIDLTKSEADWDHLTSQIAGEDFSEEKFNDLVTSFGTVLRKQIESVGSECKVKTDNCSITSETISEDTAMYELCSNMEDKAGKSLSTLFSEVEMNEDYSFILPCVDDKTLLRAEISGIDTGYYEIESLTGEVKKLMVTDQDDQIKSNISEDSVARTQNIPEVSRHRSSTGECEENKHNSTNIEAITPSTCETNVIPSLDYGDESDQDLRVISSKQENQVQHGKLSKVTSIITASNSSGVDSLSSWECVDVNSGLSSMNWNSGKCANSDKDTKLPKPSRRNRLRGDPSKWLNEADKQSNDVNDPSIASWVPVESGCPAWDTNEPAPTHPVKPNVSKREVALSEACHSFEEPQPHTGAVSKYRSQKKHRGPSLPADNTTHREHNASPKTVTIFPDVSKIRQTEVETQTLSIDFEALELDHELYELKVIFGRPHYTPVTTGNSPFHENGPLTKGNLRLEKGTMTDNPFDVSLVSSFQTLTAFFPNIPEEDLRDVFEKCKYDSDWAMNVLLDGGYEMSDPSDVTMKAEETRDINSESDSITETTSTGDGRNDQSFADASDISSSDVLVEERTRKIKQSQQPEDLAKKSEIEESFAFPEYVDDRVTRLTGKEYGNLNMTRVKKIKAKRKPAEKGNNAPQAIKSEESTDGEGEGAQYITLVMDPLFASQLIRMFGPVGDCEISGDLTLEDRSVILPLEFCQMIHKYWALSVNGKFKHEAEILDSLIRQDEMLARKLQEEEDAGIGSESGKGIRMNEGFQEDQPTCFQEIMDLEQALKTSLRDNTTSEDVSISSLLTLQRLYKEYPHVDPTALKEEFTLSGLKYPITVERLNQHYGKEQGTPKTVIAPEALDRYEQQMIEQAQQNSLAEQEQEASLVQLREEDVAPADPQVFRDEAQTHYHQRQEAFQKAQEASRRGMKAAAAYYAHIGNLHSEKLREANQRASQKILEATNAHKKDANCLDLHLLHVPEARSATQAFLNERQKVLIARGMKQMEVSLVTGRGVHSVGGKAVLKPAIKDHLLKNGYSFYEANSGMLKVTLRAKQ